MQALIGAATLVLGVLAVSIGLAQLTLALAPDSGNGTVLAGRRLRSRNVQLLLADMRDHPERYIRDEWALSSASACIWVCSGWAFYRDHDMGALSVQVRKWEHGWGPAVPVGKFTLVDRFDFMLALRKFPKPGSKRPKAGPMDFEIALRKRNNEEGT